MILDDLTVLLQAHLPAGTTIFKGRIPPDPPGPAVPDEIIALLPVPGLPPEHVHDSAGPAVRQPVIQVRFRGRATQGGYAAMWAKAEQAYVVLDSVNNQIINGVFYRTIRVLGDVAGLGEDEFARPALAFTVRAQRAGS